MVCDDCCFGSRNVGQEVLEGPYDTQALMFSSGIISLRGVEDVAITGEYVFFVT